jgi:hypothetical protein
MMSKSGIHDVQNVVENSVKVTILNKNPNPHYQKPGPMRGGSDGISVPGSESYEGAGCKSLKGPIALAIDVLF